MSKTSLVPKEQKFQFIDLQKTIKSEKVLNEKKPYYVLKQITESEGILFTEYYLNKQTAVNSGDAEGARDWTLKICELCVKDCKSGAKEPKDLEYVRLFSLGNNVVQYNLITGSQIKK